jgi:hypothetical protein
MLIFGKKNYAQSLQKHYQKEIINHIHYVKPVSVSEKRIVQTQCKGSFCLEEYPLRRFE